MIIIARLDSRLPENAAARGRAVSDNAGGLPSAVAGAAGMPMSAAGGAALNVGLALVLNLFADEAYKNRIPMAFKVLYEKDCSYGIRFLDLRTSPHSEELYPGYLARLDADTAGHRLLLPVTDDKGQQLYLTKIHPCYATWVAEWKIHEEVKRGNWYSRRFVHLFGTPPVIPDPELPWVK
jgi:hypothetical protein